MRLIQSDELCTQALFTAKKTTKQNIFSCSFSFLKKCCSSSGFVFFFFLTFEASLSARVQLHVETHSIHPFLFFISLHFSFLLSFTSNATLFKERAICVFFSPPHSWIRDIQFGATICTVRKEKTKNEGLKTRKSRARGVADCFSASLRINCMKPLTDEEKNTSFK